MKSFIAACLLLGVLVCGVWADAMFLLHTTEKLQQKAEALSAFEQEERDKAAKDISALWQANKWPFILSLDADNTDAVEDALARLELTAQENSDGNFTVAAAELIEALERVRELSGFSLAGIF